MSRSTRGDPARGDGPDGGRAQAPAGGPAPAVELAIVIVAALAYLGHLQWCTPHIVGTDSYFHMKMAQLIGRTHEAVLSFPWTTTSIFKDHFSDSSFLFHVSIIPFTWLPDEIWASKLAAVMYSTVFLVVFYLHLRSLDVPYPMFFLVLLMAAGSLLIYRVESNRGYLLSMVLAILAVGFLSRRNYLGLFIIALLYPLSYTACQVSIGLAVLSGLADAMAGEWPDHRPVVLAVLGTALGLLVHPNFPDDLLMWWVQNVRVLTLKWSGVELWFGGELYPPEMATILFSTSAITVALLAAVTLALLVPVRHRRDTFLHFLTMVFFGLMTMLSKRFVEYWAPLTVAFLGLIVRDSLDSPRLRSLAAAWPAEAMGAAWIALMVEAALLVHGYMDTRRDIAKEARPGLKEASQWLAHHTTPGTIVYTLDWDEFPQLFYYNDSDYFLVCLDPCFLYAYDPDLFHLWHNVSNALAPDVYNPIVRQFHAQWVLAKSRFTSFQVKVAGDPRFKREYYDQDCTIYHLTPDLDFLTTWAINGPYTIGRPLPIDGDRELKWALEGRLPPTSNPVLLAGWTRFDADRLGSFVDLERSLGSLTDCFAYACCRLDSPIDQDVTLRVGFDDALAVWVEGKKMMDDPGPHEVKVDDKALKIHLHQGANTLVLRCMNYKGNWGFCARLTDTVRPVTAVQLHPEAPPASPAIIVPRTAAAAAKGPP